jgi:hypothetical protein
MPAPPSRRNPFFPLVAGSGALFCVTVLALLAAPLSGTAAPAAAALERHAGWILTLEVTATLLFGFLALLADRPGPPEPPTRTTQRANDPEHQG